MAAGHRIETLRVERGWTQQKLADMVTQAGYRISQSGIDKLEKRDARRPRGIREIARVLGVNEDWLLYEKGPKEAPKPPRGFLPIDEWDEDIEREVERFRAFKYAEKGRQEGR